MSVDVSKYLHFASGGKVPPDWDRMIDMRQIPAFLTVLKEMQIGPDGILQKLDTFSHAIRYYRHILLLANPGEGQHRMSLDASEAIQRLKRTYRKRKSVRNFQRVEEQSRSMLSVEEVQDLATSPAVNQFRKEIIDEILSGGTPNKDRRNGYTTILADELMVASTQRPGAVANKTVKQFDRREKEGEITVVKVHHHKLEAKGPALLLLNPQGEACLEQYLRVVRPLVVENNQNRKMFFL